MNNMVLKIGNTELGLRALGDGDFEFKNTEVALNELANFDFVIKNQMNSSPKASNQKMNTPTLFFNDKLVTLNQVQPNLFEPTSYKLFNDLLRGLVLPNIGFDSFENEVIAEMPRTAKQGKLAIIVPFFNYSINPRMIQNYKRFRDELGHDDVFVIESTREVDFQIPESANFIRIEAKEENVMWQKERMINLAIENLPKEYTDIAWIDADILFEDKDWHKELQDRLNRYSFVQLFNTAEWLNGRGETTEIFRSPFNTVDRELRHHVGFAWAARREVLEKIGGLFDHHVSGNGDAAIYHALAKSKLDDVASITAEMFDNLPGFSYSFYCYRELLSQHTNKSIACLSGNIKHLFHGDIGSRNYNGRQQILIQNNFDPLKDLELDVNGLFRWVDKENTKEMRRLICDYFLRTSKA